MNENERKSSTVKTMGLSIPTALLLLVVSCNGFTVNPLTQRIYSVSKFSSSPASFSAVPINTPSDVPSLLLSSSHVAASPEQTTLWSALIMLSIVGLLYTWETTVTNARKQLPETLTPVLDSMLAEVGGLGFIGLFLELVVTGGPLGHIIGELSEKYLGEEEILLESFEFLHAAFFQVGIGFFAIAGLTTFKALKKVQSIEVVSETIFDINRDGHVSLEELADALKVSSLSIDINKNGELGPDEIRVALRSAPKTTSIWEELFLSSEFIKAEALVIRERFLETCKVPETFRIETYFSRIFGENLKEIVELSPLTWLPLIPAISLGRSVDLTRNVVSASSPNAAESCGFFLGTPLTFGVTVLFVMANFVWGCYNFWKMKAIKDMVVPVLLRDTACNGKVRLLPPRYEDPYLVERFNSSPGIFGVIEGFFGKPARNCQEELFGAAGAAGPELFCNAIKLQSWVVVSQIVFFGAQIVARDVYALANGLETGNPDLVVPELIVFSYFIVQGLVQLAIAPQTFFNYSLITSVEQLADELVIKETLEEEVEKSTSEAVVA